MLANESALGVNGVGERGEIAALKRGNAEAMPLLEALAQLANAAEPFGMPSVHGNSVTPPSYTSIGGKPSYSSG